MQVQHVNPYNKEHELFKNPLECVKRVLKEQGISGLWRGNFASILRHGPQQVSKHVLDHFKQYH